MSSQAAAQYDDMTDSNGDRPHSRSFSYGAVRSDSELEHITKPIVKRPDPNPYTFRRQLVYLLRLAWPITIIQITQYSFGFIATIFCGQAGTTALDTVALANSIINVFGISIAVGLSSACDTLFAQIYGSPNKKLLGTVVQRSIIIIMLALLPCIAIHINAEHLLRLVGQDAAVAKMTGEYLFLFLPGLISFFFYIIVSKYLMAQNIIYPPMIFGLLSNIVNATLHYLFMNIYGLTTDGSAYAQMASYTLMCVLNVLYLLCGRKYKGTWDGWSLDCLYEWGPFLKLALAGLIMLCIEWWTYEAGIFITGLLGTVDLGAQAIVFQLETIYIMFPMGIAVSVSIIVGQYLGAGDKEGAKMATKVALVTAVVIGILFAALFSLGHEALPSLISNDPEVIAVASPVLYILAVYAVFDAISSACGGILRGGGRQHLGAIVVTLGYTVALGLGISLMFLTNLRIQGLWIGLAVTLFLQSMIYVTIILRCNWDALVDQAQKRSLEANVIEHVNDELIRSTMAVEDDSEDEEAQGLLSSGSSGMSGSGRFSISIRSNVSLLSAEEKPIVQRLSSNPYQPPFPKPVRIRLQRKRCSWNLFCRRFSYIGFCLLTFGVGLFCRLWLPAPMLNIANVTSTTMSNDFTTVTTTILSTFSTTFANITDV